MSISRIARSLLLAAALLPASLHAADKASSASALSAKQRVAVQAVIKDYLLQNPEVVRDAIFALQAKESAEKQKRAAGALKQYRNDLVQDPDSPVAGNPDGDVTVVEFFDYNCGYCKKVASEVTGLIAADAKVRVVFKEYPILGPTSMVGARAALAAARQGKYLEFHLGLMSPAQIDDAAIQKLAEKLGLDHARLVKDMADPAIEAQLMKNYKLAEALDISGTPAFIVGDRVVPGAADAATLGRMVSEQRGAQGKR